MKALDKSKAFFYAFNFKKIIRKVHKSTQSQ